LSKVKICHIRRDTNGIITHRRFIKPKSAIVRREGSRAPDNMEFTSDLVPQLRENDEIYYIQDVVDTDNLVGMYNFYGNFRDESGFEQDFNRSSGIDIPECVDKSTAGSLNERLRLSDPSATSMAKKYRGFYKMTENATSDDGVQMKKAFYQQNTANSPIIDLSGDFDIWIEYASNLDVGLYTLLDFYNESTSKGFILQLDMANNQIKITCNDGGTANISTGSFTASTDMHLLRFYRQDGTLKLYIDKSEITLTNSSFSGDMNDSNQYWYMCKKYDESTSTWSDGFYGWLFQLRFYTQVLSDDDATVLWTCKAQQLTMKFGGFVWRIDDGVTRRIQCKGWSSKVLSKIISPSTITNAPSFSEVSRTGVLYTGGQGSEILRDVIENIGDNEFCFTTEEPSSNPIQYTFGSLNAYGTLLDLLEFIIVMSSSSKKYFFNVLPRKTIIIDEELDANLACNDKTSDVIEQYHDDSRTVNMLEISANNQIKHDVYTRPYSATGTEYVIQGSDTLNNANNSDVVVETLLKATINGNDAPIYMSDETLPSGQYGIKLNISRDKFEISSPNSTGNTVKLWFTFRYFILNALSTIQVITDPTSVNTIGEYPRRINVKQLDDGINLGIFANRYLNLYKNVKKRVKVRFNGLVNSVTIGQKLPVHYVTKKLYTSYDPSTEEIEPERLNVSSIEYRYPEGITILELGENEFNTFDLEKITIEGLRGVDNSISKNTLI